MAKTESTFKNMAFVADAHISGEPSACLGFVYVMTKEAH